MRVLFSAINIDKQLNINLAAQYYIFPKKKTTKLSVWMERIKNAAIKEWN